MLEWFKRIATSAPREQLVENQANPVAEKVSRLADRTVTTAPPEQLVEHENQTIPTEEKVSRLVSRLETSDKSAAEVAARSAPMRVIVVASQKGGVGKTTIAAHLAVCAVRAGEGPAVLVDTDPQGSLSQWGDARKEEHVRDDDMPAVVTVKLDDLATKLAELRNNGAAVAVIDTPPAITASIEKAISMADLVITPARASPHDLRAIGATLKITRGARKPFVFIVNGAVPRANITAEAVAALSEHGPVAPTILYQRTDYAASMIDGRTVMEAVPNGRSAQEIAGLWKYVHAQLSLAAAA